MRLFHHTLRLTGGLVLAALAAVALGLSLLRFWLLPQIDILRHHLEVVASHELHQPVSIGRLGADIRHLTPKLRLLDLRIGYRHPLRIGELQLVPDLAASLLERQLRLQRIRIVGAHLEIRPTPDGHWRILGLPSDPDGLPAWLLRDGRFELVRTTLVWHHHPDRPPLTLEDVNLRLHNQGDAHRLQLLWPTPAGALRATVDFRLPAGTTPWQGRFIVQGRRLPLDRLTAALLPQPWQGQGDISLWGHWRGRQGGLEARLALHNLHVPVPGLKRPPGIALAAGQFHFAWETTGWRLQSDRLTLANADAVVHSRLRLAGSWHDVPRLDLRSHIGYLNLARLHAYLPRTATDAATWLQRNLRGRLQGDLLWHGPVDGWPFTDHQGHVEARLTATDAWIRFHDQWPPVTGTAVEIRLDDARLSGRLLTGRIAATPIRRLTARLDLRAPTLPLQLAGETPATLDQARRLLRRSPLQEAIRQLDQWLEVQGRGRVTLQIRVPLQDPAGFRLQGSARIHGPALTLKSPPLTLNAYHSRLDFDQDHCEAAIEGRWRGQPTRIEVSSRPEDTHVHLRTRLVAAETPELSEVGGIHGATEIQGELVIPHRADTTAVLQLESDLQGLAIDRPPPLGKTATERRTFSAKLWLRAHADIPVGIDYPPFDAALVWHRQRKRLSGRIGINQPPPPPVDPSGISVQGKLAQLALDPWLAWRQTAAVAAYFPLRRLDLEVRHLHWHHQDLGRHRLHLTRNENGWRGHLDSDYVRGEGELTADRLDLDLDFLDLARLQRMRDATGSHDAKTPWRYALHLRCRRLHWNRIDLGHLQLTLQPRPSHTALHLTLEADTHRLEARGRWLPAFPAHTELEGRFSSPDLGRFLQRIQHPTLLVETPTRLDFRLRWPGPPYDFDLSRLDGELHLHTGPGRLPAIEPGAGRLLGLLYLGTLQRRLRLDFSDLFAKGLAYERIDGRIHLRQGSAVTDDFLVDAVPARITISGSADLQRRRVDEIVTVRPNTPFTLGVFSQSEGLAGRLQRLFNAPLDSLTQSQYAITGPWDDPTIVRIRRSLPESLWKALE